MPALTFQVVQIEVAQYAASPSLIFKLRISAEDGETLEGLTLQTQIRIAASQRAYTTEEQARLVELFGASIQWGSSLKSLLWAHSVIHVPAFTGETVVDLPVTCTYDFDVTSAKYFHSLTDGQIPLELYFSGTMFVRGPGGGLQIAPIPWDREAQCRLPVSVWKRMIEVYFPSSAWLRLPRDMFERLYRYRTEKGLPSWEAALEELLRAHPEQVPR